MNSTLNFHNISLNSLSTCVKRGIHIQDTFNTDRSQESFKKNKKLQIENISLNQTKYEVIKKHLTPLQIEILNILIRYCHKFKTVFISQTLIAQLLGCNRSTVNRYLKRLAQLQLIKKNSRYRETSVYQLCDVFILYAHKLRHLFSALKYVWNIQDLLSWLPSKKDVLKHNFLKMSHLVLDKYIKYSPVHKLTRDRGVMMTNSVEKLEISPALRKVTEILHLTKWGQINLTCFPEEALEFALKNYSNSTSFNTFFLNALNFCRDHNIEPDFNLLAHLKRKYHMPEHANFVYEKPSLPEAKLASVLSSTSSWREKLQNKDYTEEQKSRIMHLQQEFAALGAPGSHD